MFVFTEISISHNMLIFQGVEPVWNRSRKVLAGMSKQVETFELAELAYSQVVEQAGNPYKKYVQFFRVLIDGLIKKAEESSTDVELVSLDPVEISALLGRKTEDHEFERKHINKNLLPYLLKDLEVIQPSINSHALKKGIRKKLVPVRINREKNRVSYGIKLEELTDQEQADANIDEDKNLLPSNVINYRLAKLPRPNCIAKYFQKMTLDNKAFWVWMAIPILPMIVGLIWFEYLLFTRSYNALAWFVLGAFVLYLCWLLISPFYNLQDRKIAMAPFWMLNLKTLNAQIEMRQKDKIGPLGKPIKELTFVVYEGECPICGGHVDIVQGRKQHKDRLIGRCSNNGVEHIFSFDQVTKKGVPLRQDTYTKEHEKTMI